MIKQVLWNPSEHRLRGGWRVSLFLAAFVTTFWGLGKLWDLVAPALRGCGPAGKLLEPVAGKVCALLLVLAMLALAARFLDRRRFADYGFHFNRRWWRLFAAGIMAGLVIHQMPTYIALLTGHAKVAEVLHRANDSIPFAFGMMVAVPHMLVIGFWEESVHRGYPVRNLMEAFNRVSPRIAPYSGIFALLTSGVFFALFHLFNGFHEVDRLVFLALWGMCLAAIFSVHGELAFPIGYHAASDFAVFHGVTFDVNSDCFVLLQTPATLPIDYQWWYGFLMLGVFLWLASVTSKPGYQSPLGQYGGPRLADGVRGHQRCQDPYFTDPDTFDSAPMGE